MDVIINLKEGDVPGSKLPCPVVEDNTASDLVRWIQTRGLAANSSQSKISLVKRVKQLKKTIFSSYVVDPDKSLTYEIIQEYANSKTVNIPLPLISKWKSTMEFIPKDFTYASIYEYLVKREVVVLNSQIAEVDRFDLPIADKPLVKSYNFFKSGHLLEFSTNNTDEYIHLWSKVLASERDDTYSVKVTLDANGIILTSSCKCPAGKGGKCNHVACTLFGALDYNENRQKTSTTDKPQVWHCPSRKRKADPQEIGEKMVRRHVFGKVETRKSPLDGYADFYPVPDDRINIDYEKLRDKASAVGHDMCLDQILSVDDVSDEEEDIPVVLTDEQKKEIIISELKITDEEAARVEKETMGQAENIKWFRAKKGRITASICKDCCGKGKPENKIKRIITVGKPRKKYPQHMEYGIKNEPIAAKKFEEQLTTLNITPIQLDECGLFISPTDYMLGASPDKIGTIGADKCVVEIKCLSSCRDLSVPVAIAKKQRESSFAFTLKDDEISMKKTHSYYYQVQMQMAITDRSICYFVIFTSDTFPVKWFKVNFDSKFWEEKRALLLDFHKKHVLPALCIQRFPS